MFTWTKSSDVCLSDLEWPALEAHQELDTFQSVFSMTLSTITLLSILVIFIPL